MVGPLAAQFRMARSQSGAAVRRCQRYAGGLCYGSHGYVDSDRDSGHLHCVKFKSTSTCSEVVDALTAGRAVCDAMECSRWLEAQTGRGWNEDATPDATPSEALIGHSAAALTGSVSLCTPNSCQLSQGVRQRHANPSPLQNCSVMSHSSVGCRELRLNCTKLSLTITAMGLSHRVVPVPMSQPQSEPVSTLSWQLAPGLVLL